MANIFEEMRKKEIDREITEEERNWYRKAPDFLKNPALKGLTEDAQILFSRLEGCMSPENLTCDGELSRTEVNRRLRSLWSQWKTLEKRYKVKADPCY